MVGLPHPELVGGGAGAGQRDRVAALALDLELEVRDRAVDGVVLGPDRVGVDPADEVARLGEDVPADLDPLPGELELARGRLVVDLGRADPVEAAEPVRLAVEVEDGVGDPGRLAAGRS